MDELLSDYRNAASSYSEEAFERFFKLAKIENTAPQLVFKDMLAASGAFYIFSMRHQQKSLPKGDMLKELSRAKKASANLESSLKTILSNGGMWSHMSEAGLALHDDLIETHGKDSDTYKILSSIFPFDKDGHGFRQTGLENAISFLNTTLETITADQLRKSERGHLAALIPWVSAISVVWVLAKGDFPAIGHYDKEIGDYDSPDIAALVFVIEQIAPKVSSRMIVKAVVQAKLLYSQSPMEFWLHYSGAMFVLLGSGETHTHKENLKMFLRLPTGAPAISDADFDRIWGSMQNQSSQGIEQSFVSKEQFVETLISSKQGNQLLQGLMEITPK